MECYRATKIQEALKILNQHKNCKLIAGGTDFVIKMRKGQLNCDFVIDISSVEELKGIREVGEYIEIGAATTFSEIVDCVLVSNRLKGLKSAAKSVGSPQIRNRGTVGGNICNASPAADMVPALLALDSSIILESVDSKREISLRDFFVDKGKTIIQPNEILTTIKFKNPTKNQALGFYKIGLRKSLAISRISFAVFLEIDSINRIEMFRAASGSIGKFPMREYKLEEFLIGRIFDEDALNMACRLLEEDVFDRLSGRNTAKFKSIASSGCFKRAIELGMDECRG
ncbi:Nicotinate dehydrogenase FAD-subunit [Caloramator mitchellensis]|uniref:Nicotinate dehydrogenase FAD-subunit n=1 Tax=Caloramator mitchellensis TaxID=908809 RepID=A0A0R3JVF2_CALMK|nr:xanthine dehydrogenase family protein subunit M [Caloramator mitchellensis]KRQ87577.1 Nicotinate dehydrogenase FAD-subunit [Caloramator mitchellensis]